MAKEQNNTPKGTESIETNAFLKGMNKDFNPNFQPKENWVHARNTVNSSLDGDAGLIGNEPANLKCGVIPYTIIGAIHLYADQWIIFSTDDTNSEIGKFDDSECKYVTLLNDQCLNFNRENLIIGASKENFNCTWQIYWDDGVNPSRTLNIDDIPYVRRISSAPGADCITYEDTNELDCEKLRLAPLVKTPNVKLSKAPDGGLLRNGMYQAYIAYTVNEQKVTDYIGISNLQSLFDHDNTATALDIHLENLDTEFDYFELVILSNTANNYVAKRMGLYSTQTTKISIDYIDQSLTSIPLAHLPLRTPAYEKSDGMFVVNDWLIRKGPTEQFDFNYQPRANQIKTKWVVAEYPASYYYKGGNKASLLRDEQYAFFIRWIYNTGERSRSYHIPGRPAKINGRTPWGDLIDETQQASGGPNVVDVNDMNFQIFNTATITNQNLSIPTDDGGTIIAKGECAYWESTEKYPSDRPDIWNSTYVDPVTGINIGGTSNPAFDLCGKYIRHHKMPTEEIGEALKLSTQDGENIRILGVEFSDIKPPIYNDGTIIPNIVGYEIMRGSREGNKSILAKGIFRNMRKYEIPEGGLTTNSDIGLYPNYPYNDLNPDIYFHDGKANDEHRTDGCDNFTQSINNFKPLGDAPDVDGEPAGYKRDHFTFHSPELMFYRPFLNAYETRIYGEVFGKSTGHFIKSENHPQNKLLRNAAAIVAGIIGVGYAISRVKGEQTYSLSGPSFHISSYLPDTIVGAVPGAVLSTPGTGVAQTGIATAASVGTLTLVNAISQLINQTLLNDLTDIASLYAGGNTANQAVMLTRQSAGILEAALPGVNSGNFTESYNITHPTGAIPKTIQLFGGLIIGKTNVATGSQEIIDVFYNLISKEDYVYKYNSHGFYNNFRKLSNGKIFRTKNLDSNFIGSSFQSFNGFKVNNLFRPKTVCVATKDQLDDPFHEKDNSRFCIGGDFNIPYYDDYLKNPEQNQVKNISSLYGALKFSMENQYGQLDAVKQIHMRGSVEHVTISFPNQKFNSSPIFSGDVYINRYTEKTIMPIFSDFLNGQPDDYTYDYLQRINIPYPRYWMNTRKFDTTALAEEIITLGFAKSENLLPNDLFYLDRGSKSCYSTFGDIFNSDNPNPAFAMRYAYMYSHVNGILDFFVESEYNLAQRDWEEHIKERHFDTYTFNNVDDLFHADIIREDNYYRYDVSLSASKFLSQITNFGEVQPRDYDPLVSEKCYNYYPKRLIYSLQAKDESKKDFWRVFLPNNYKDFKNPVTTIKSINKSGALIFFPYQAPQMFRGIDELQTDLGVKLVIGDGGLFSQPFQNVTNSDAGNEYGSCESHRSVINTPAGLFFISQQQGKIFQYTGQLENIANAGMKWWFNKYLPSQLLKQFPDLEGTFLNDNPVVGIGCQAIYDATDDLVYFSKRDYRVKDEFINNIVFYKDSGFFLRSQFGVLSIELGDPYYFEDVSWTVSYDPKFKAWISFHDWHPELAFTSTNHFFTTKTLDETEPYCPPGYVFNPSTLKCEITADETSLAPLVVHEVGSIRNGDVCTCPTGYTLVYKVGSYYTGANGSCFGDNPPICRKLICQCPGNNIPNSNIITSGQCDDIYLTGPTGDPNYINSNPLTCTYRFQNQIPPSYKRGTIWRHNYRCDLYSNFYGINYPWEVEFITNSGQNVNTVKSLEYQLESFVYKGDFFNGCGDDRWHDLDFNFDELIIYNTEQVSGLLKINEQPKEDPNQRLNYPIVNTNSIDIVASKEEQKYRINQFWDITNDRGEFTNVEQSIFNTQENGYIRDLNFANLNYNKSEFERKKFRHYYNRFILRRTLSLDRKMLLKLNNVKLNMSFR